MANFDDLKQKAKDAMETIADVSVEVYKIAEEKAKVLAKTTKLNTEITREKSLIKRLYGEIGSKYYELHKDAPESELEQSCSEITDAFERIAAKRRELEDLKNSSDCCEDACCSEPEDDEPEDDEPEIEVEIIVEEKDGEEPNGTNTGGGWKL